MYRLSLPAFVLFAAFLSAGCGSDSFSPDLAFVSSRDGDYAIYATGADGGSERRLTEDYDVQSAEPGELFRAIEPAWSPDGTELAFSSQRDGRQRIYVMNADGSNVRRLTTSKLFDANPSWSPDGSRIVYSGGAGDLYVVKADGSGVRRLTTSVAEERDPAWSPDGYWIAYERREPGGPTREIWVSRTDGTGARQLTRLRAESYAPTWSPNSKRVAFSSNANGSAFQIYSIGLDGKDIIRHTDSADAFEPAVSPDGKRIAFSRDGAVYTVDVTGFEKKLTSGRNDSSPAWRPAQPVQR